MMIEGKVQSEKFKLKRRGKPLRASVSLRLCVKQFAFVLLFIILFLAFAPHRPQLQGKAEEEE